MDRVLSLVIHEILPTEILEMIFEEHAMLEWEAPTIDGQVCRFWREIVLNTPRAWAYLEIREDSMPSNGEVRVRLHRSSSASLHVDTREVGLAACQEVYNLFSGHRTRIVSLRTRFSSETFFQGRDFPCLQLLDIEYWYPIRWGSMPKLQSLWLRGQMLRTVPLSELAPLKMLALSSIKCTSILRHSQSLTTLMLSNVVLVDATSCPVALPCLTYLSLLSMRGLKPHVNAPRLVTYHEGGVIVYESFNTPLPSLLEYGVFLTLARRLDPAKLHFSFPNIQRLAIRAAELVILSFFTCLANQPHSIPALQTISVGNGHVSSYRIAENVREKIERLVLVRNEACNGSIALCFESVAPFQIPIFLGAVSDLSVK